MRTTYINFFIAFWLLICAQTLRAQAIGDTTANTAQSQGDLLTSASDSLLRIGKTDAALQTAQQALHLARQNDDDKAEAEALLCVGNAWAQKGRYHKALAQFNRSLRVKKAFHDRTKMANLYHDMAVAFTNLKMYPQALKYHYKALALYQRNQVNDSNTHSYSVLLQAKPKWKSDSTCDNTVHVAAIPALYFACDNDVNEADTTDRKEVEAPSIPIDNNAIPSYFNDGKQAMGYGIMIHVKQPSPGKRKTFVKITTVGHVFVTLVKFNTDCSTTSKSFGFYPKRSKLFSATPLRPEDFSTFKDDGKHNWDEVVGKLITKQKFDRVLELVENYKNKKYHLNTSNCTDFGLDAAAVAGININNTVGSWPGGKGNNPGSTGESILEGQVDDADNSGLFIYSTVGKK